MDSTRLDPSHTFQMRVEPGTYQLRLRIGSQEPGEIRIKGAIGGDKKLPAPKEESTLTTQIGARTEPLSLSSTACSDIYWLILIKQPIAAE